MSRRVWKRVGLVGLCGLLVVGSAGGLVWWNKERAEAQRAEELGPMIDRIAGEHGLDPSLVRAVIDAESGFDPRAVSNLGARGLMQIMPNTHLEVERVHGITRGDLFDPEHNLTVGCAYLRQLLDRFDQDLTLALAAYHMGPTRVARLRRRHPRLSPTELVKQHAGPATRAYVTTVLADYR